MHELSIAMSLIDIAEAELERQGGGQVLTVHVKIGPLCGVVGDALHSAFEMARAESALANATLEIEETAVTLYCPQCDGEQPARSLQDLRCLRCDTYSGEILGGRELELVAMEVEG
jgi:hydrogenase nickel incorporation protein HypA/HybF